MCSNGDRMMFDYTPSITSEDKMEEQEEIKYRSALDAKPEKWRMENGRWRIMALFRDKILWDLQVVSATGSMCFPCQANAGMVTALCACLKINQCQPASQVPNVVQGQFRFRHSRLKPQLKFQSSLQSWHSSIHFQLLDMFELKGTRSQVKFLKSLK